MGPSLILLQRSIHRKLLLFASMSHLFTIGMGMKCSKLGPSKLMKSKLFSISMLKLFLQSVFVLFMALKPLSTVAMDRGKTKMGSTMRRWSGKLLSHSLSRKKVLPSIPLWAL